MSNLKYEVWEALKLIPAGKVTTYGQLASFLGTKGVRAVASWVAKNPYAPAVPCHRVILSDGRVGQYSGMGGVKQKAALLKSEGVKVKDGKVVDFKKHLFKFKFKFNNLVPKGYELVLASASPRRHKLLKMFGVKFQVAPADIDETLFTSLPVSKQVKKLALAKAQAVVRNLRQSAIVIGADTLVEFEGHALGKPASPKKARKMLKLLNGQKVTIYSGLAVIESQTKKTQVVLSKTEVKLKKLSDRLISWYVKTGEPMDKAGAFAIQGLGAGLVEDVKGDYYSALGLSLFELVKLTQARCRSSE